MKRRGNSISGTQTILSTLQSNIRDLDLSVSQNKNYQSRDIANDWTQRGRISDASQGSVKKYLCYSEGIRGLGTENRVTQESGSRFSTMRSNECWSVLHRSDLRPQ